MLKNRHAKSAIPSLVDPGLGCPIAPRCPYEMDICRKTMPQRRNLSEDHWVACHRHSEQEQAE